MVDLEFPGGVARVDNDRVWEKLAAWASGGEGRSVRLCYTGRAWRAELRDIMQPVDADTFRASSKLSMADAVANALQVVYASDT